MLKPYEEYKKSKSPFHRNIPSHWTEKRLAAVCSIKCVQNNEGEELLSVFLNRGVINYKDTHQKQVHKPSEDMSKYQLVEPGDLVLNNQQAWRGSVGVSKYRGIVSPAYYVYSINDDINPFFLNYMVRDRDVVDQFVLASKGVGSIQRMLNNSYLKNVIFTIPPREEQGQIVRFLDWKLAKINKLIRAKKRQIALLNEQKQVIINNAVTKGLDPNVPMKDSGIEWIGPIPEHWKILYLSQTATEQSISNKDIHNQNLLSLSYGKIINKDINTTDGLLPASFDTYQIVHNGNIILRLTDLQNDHKSLRVGLATQTGIITSAYTCLLPRGNVVPEFLYMLLHSYDVCKVFYGMGGGVRQSIGFNDIRKLLILVPPLEEQKQIKDFCYTKSDFIEGLIVSIEKEIMLLIEYRNRLISDVVTGKVDVRDIEIPKYETVSDEATDDKIDDNFVLDEEDVETGVE